MPQNDAVQAFYEHEPKGGQHITTVAGIAAGGVLVFKAISPGERCEITWILSRALAAAGHRHLPDRKASSLGSAVWPLAW